MKRRDFVKAMMAATVSGRALLAQQPGPVAPAVPPQVPTTGTVPPPPGPVPWMRGLMEVKPLPLTPLVADAVALTTSHFFAAQPMATLHRLCSLLLPAAAPYPGAVEAGTPAFLDFLIGASPADRQQMYIAGLDRLQTDAQQRFGIAFAAANDAQADTIVRPWLRTWMNDHPPAEPQARFINTAHSDIRTATLNSEAWSRAAAAAGQQTPEVGLYWFPIDPDMRARDRAQLAGRS